MTQVKHPIPSLDPNMNPNTDHQDSLATPSHTPQLQAFREVV